jgi:hypothetical protein
MHWYIYFCDRSLKIYTKKTCSENAFKTQANERDNALIAIKLITYIFLRYLSIQISKFRFHPCFLAKVDHIASEKAFKKQAIDRHNASIAIDVVALTFHEMFYLNIQLSFSFMPSWKSRKTAGGAAAFLNHFYIVTSRTPGGCCGSLLPRRLAGDWRLA